MDYENNFANKVITRIMEDTGFEINITKLAHIMKKPVPSIWNKVTHRRKWDAETWLQTLWVLGYARYVQNDLTDGHINIKVPLTKHEIAKFDQLRTNEIFVSQG